MRRDITENFIVQIRKFGEDSINIIYEFDNTDFSTVDDYVGING